MSSRILPNLGLKAFFALGEDGWNTDVDNNFLKLSTLVQAHIISVVTTLPNAPSQGDTYLLNSNATSNPNTIAVFDNSAWTNFSPSAGWMIYDSSLNAYHIYNGSTWNVLPLPNLESIGVLPTTLGVIEQTASNVFGIRAIGAGADTSLLQLADANARYSLLGHTHPPSGVTSFNTRTFDVILTSSDVSTALGFTPEAATTALAGLGTLDTTLGLVEQTGATTYGKRNIGVVNSTDIPSRADGDARYQLHSGVLTGVSALDTSLGLVEQYGSLAFRIRSIGGINNTDILTRGTADSLYTSITTEIAILNQSNVFQDLVSIACGISSASQDYLRLAPTDSGSSGKPYFFVKNDTSTIWQMGVWDGSGSNGTIDFFTNGLTWNGTTVATTTGVQAEVDLKLNKYTSISNETGTSYTLQLADAGSYLRISNSAPNTVVVSLNATIAFPIGTQIAIYQSGAGQTTISSIGGVTVNTPETLNLRKQFSSVTLVKVDTDTWDLIGDLEAAS